MVRSRLLLLIAFVILISEACTSSKANDYESNARAFLDLFEKNLVATDETIMKQFKIQQTDGMVTEEGILKAIRVMQNHDQAGDSVFCTVNFKGATITQENAGIRVEVAAEFSSMDPLYPLTQEGKFTLWLISTDGEFTISKIDAADFYGTYRDVVRTLSTQKNRERVLASLQIHLEQARKLQQTYDTVVWYTLYNDSIYYYVANGTFKNYFTDYGVEHPHTFTMGLVSETGRVIVPPAFDLVGTIGFSIPGVIEVQKDGKVGYFSIEGKELTPAVYDWIVPSESINDETYVLVKQDTLNGWLDKSYAFHEGFPDKKTEKYIREFEYLGNATLISKDVNTITKILHVDYTGYGIVIPASYLVTTGILRDVVPEVNLGDEASGSDMAYYGTEYIKSEGSIFERISENLSALFVMIEGRYLGGREDFYRYKTLTFVDNKGGVVSSEKLYAGENKFKHIDSTLLELNVTMNESDISEFMGDEAGDWNPPQYLYFRISEGNSVTALKSQRSFACTEFVKMDSSYLTGEFLYWDSTQNNTVTRPFVSIETMTAMRNEILASYGYTFTDPKAIEYFKYRDWYVMRYRNYEDFMEEMTEIDKHNLAFLESMIGTLRTKPA